MDLSNIEKVAQECERVLNLKHAKLSDEYFYQSLPLCVIDAVYSLRARYESTKRVVMRYCNYFNLRRIREDKENIPPVETQESIEEFLGKMRKLGIEKFTNEVFRNRQKTSTRGGILKSEAVLKFAEVLNRFGVNYLQDVPKVIHDISFERQIRSIPGQTSGISLRYFFMLSGSNDFIKPDRMILRFLERILKRTVSTQEAQALLYEVVKKLKPKYPHLTPRLLDHEIWKYERQSSR